VPHQKNVTTEELSVSVPNGHAWIITTMPRGGLQIASPATVGENLVKNYTRELQEFDTISWQVLRDGKPVTADGNAASRWISEMAQATGAQSLVGVPLKDPVLEGYPGVLLAYRVSSGNPFTAAEIEQIAQSAKQLGAARRASRQQRLAPDYATLPAWAHGLPERFMVLDAHANVLIGSTGFNKLDDRLRDQLQRDARARLARNAIEGALAESVRLPLPDSRGDLWTFRCTVYRKLPALSHGPAAAYCLEPACYDWSTLRPTDIQADVEMARLVPSMEFMQKEYARGPGLTEISRIVHLSPFHFHRRFSGLMGVTPKHFMLESQIFDAKSQLASGANELVEIAANCGFAHQSHFTSRFKQATGLTPTRWRRMAAKLTEGARKAGLAANNA